MINDLEKKKIASFTDSMENQNAKVKSQNQKSKYQSDLKVRCYHFSLAVIKMSDSLPNKRSAWVLSDQLIRSSTSIGANLVEAHSSNSRLEFKKYHEIVLKSANETRYWLGLMRDSKMVEKNAIDRLLDEVTEIANMIAAGVMKLKKKT